MVDIIQDYDTIFNYAKMPCTNRKIGDLRVSGGFPIYIIEYIAFARYPPRSETSHDGGLVDLQLRHISHVSSYSILFYLFD